MLAIGSNGLRADDNKFKPTSRSPEVVVSIFGLKLFFGSMFFMHSVAVQIPDFAKTLPMAEKHLPPIVSFSMGIGLIGSALYDVVSYCHQNVSNNGINR